MNFTKIIGLLALIFVFTIACAGISEKSETEQLAEESENSNLNGPWTGKWRVESSRQQEASGIWVLKQSGSSVISAEESQYKASGKVKGNQLKGKFIDTWNSTRNFVLEIAPDGQSFKGGYAWTGTGTEFKLNGTKQE